MPELVKPRKKNALTLHKDRECGCSISTNVNECVYQQFLDGWEFTPDVGNGQKRGEVFTPRFIVDRMMEEVGIFPKAAIYDYHYTTVSKDQMKAIILSKVLEPAVGTGNYLSTVLWHKLEYAYAAALNDDNTLDFHEYHKNILQAVASIYAFDIDAGNLEVLSQRLLKKDFTINADETIEHWTDKIQELLNSGNNNTMENIVVENTAIENADAVKNVVKESLDAAYMNWSDFLQNDGILQKTYIRHTDEVMPAGLVHKCAKILESNIQLFNGIVESDTVEDNFIVPGWANVVWRWWTVSDSKDTDSHVLELSFDNVYLSDQMISGEIEQLQKEADFLQSHKMVEKDDGLFSIMDWDTTEDAVHYSNLVKKIRLLKKKLR